MTVGRIELVLPDRPVESIEQWLAEGGGDGLARARELGPEETIAYLGRAGVRGRGVTVARDSRPRRSGGR